MAHNRTKLNSLIFHNQIMLPRTSPGFGEVSLAVAELQGGDPRKASHFAEAAVAKDSGLAAGWLAKATADVFAGNGADVRVERAMFCLERAFECAPECRREMTEFFVTSLLARYLSLVCEAAMAHLAESKRLDGVGFTASSNARTLDTIGLVAAITAFCAKCENTKIVSGLTAVAVSAEAAVQRGYAFAFSDAAEYSATMAVMHVGPAYRLLWITAQMLKLEALPEDLLDPLVAEFTRTVSRAVNTHLDRLRPALEKPLWEYLSTGTMDGFDPATRRLESAYTLGRDLDQLIQDDAELPVGAHPLDAPHPDSRALLRCLDEVLSGARETDAYQLLASPRQALARVVNASPQVPASPQALPPALAKPQPSGCSEMLGCVGSFGLWILGWTLLKGTLNSVIPPSVNYPQATLLALVLTVVGFFGFRFTRYSIRRINAMAEQDRQHRAQAKEDKRRATENKRLVSSTETPRERLAALVSRRCRMSWFGKVEYDYFANNSAPTIWSVDAWMGDHPEQRIKAHLFGPIAVSLPGDALEVGTDGSLSTASNPEA